MDNRFRFRPKIGQKIKDPRRGGFCFLEKVIGISSDHHVYKASYYAQNYSSNGNSAPTKFVTVKYVSARSGNDLRRITERASIVSSNVIDVESWYLWSRLLRGLVIILPYMSEGSLRYLLSSKFHYGLPEDCIAIALKEALLGLKVLHDLRRIHMRFNAGDIFVNYNPEVANIEIKLAIGKAVYNSDPEFNMMPKKQPANRSDDFCDGSSSVMPIRRISEWSAPPEGDDGTTSCYTNKSDIWFVGITALELAYGNIRACNRAELYKMIYKIQESKKLPVRLEDLLEKKGKMKKVMSFIKNKMMKLVNRNDERPFSREFEKVVLKCLKYNESKRPTVDELLQFPFFENAKDLKWFQRIVLHGKSPVPTGDESDDDD